jgi:hypothetical protein
VEDIVHVSEIDVRDYRPVGRTLMLELLDMIESEPERAEHVPGLHELVGWLIEDAVEREDRDCLRLLLAP